MTISPPEREGKKARIVVDNDPVPTSFEKWAQPGHFDRTLARGPKTRTWIWNLHANAHDFDSQTSDLEDISRKIFAAHFGHLAVVFIWLSGMMISRCALFKLRSLAERSPEH
jgi:photosystem I P700 chlorophyll a apoprotein A1